MLDFLKKLMTKPEKIVKKLTLYSVVDGEIIDISQVSDPVYAQRMMGDGFAIEPEARQIYAPAEGEVIHVFPTRHAIGIRLINGIEILINIGIDTVTLEGHPFSIKVKEGDKVNKYTLLAEVDFDAVEKEGKDKIVIVVLTNMEEVASFGIQATGEKRAGERIGIVKSK